MNAKLALAPRVLLALTLSAAPLLAGVGTQTQEFLAQNGQADDEFARSLSINSSGKALVGAPGGVTGFTATGHAYLFEASTGTQLSKLTPSNGMDGDRFGLSVSISGETAVVGAPFADGVGSQSGLVYVFDASTGTESFILEPDDASHTSRFGYSVAVSGTTAVIGTPGDNVFTGPGSPVTDIGWAYLFNTTTGLQTARLDPLDGQVDDFFGWSVAISGNTALVGAPDHSVNFGDDAGAVYVFDTLTGAQVHKLISPDAMIGGNFGSSVAIRGTTAVIGCPAGIGSGGAAYVFDTSTGLLVRKLTAADAVASEVDRFGSSVAINETAIVVGARFDDEFGASAGSAYLFDAASGIQLAKLGATGGQPNDNFGYTAAISSSGALVGAPFNDGLGPNAGAAYLFELATQPATYCTAGLSAAGCQALLAATGVASASAPSGFELSASGVEGQKDGLFFLGTSGRQSNSWGNGTSLQCVAPPVARAGLLSGSGLAGQCDGAFAQDLNAHWTLKPAQNPGAGAVVQAQLWYRDPQSTSNQTTSLSDALEFVVVP